MYTSLVVLTYDWLIVRSNTSSIHKYRQQYTELKIEPGERNQLHNTRVCTKVSETGSIHHANDTDLIQSVGHILSYEKLIFVIWSYMLCSLAMECAHRMSCIYMCLLNQCCHKIKTQFVTPIHSDLITKSYLDIIQPRDSVVYFLYVFFILFKYHKRILRTHYRVFTSTQRLILLISYRVFRSLCTTNECIIVDSKIRQFKICLYIYTCLSERVCV